MVGTTPMQSPDECKDPSRKRLRFSCRRKRTVGRCSKSADTSEFGYWRIESFATSAFVDATRHSSLEQTEESEGDEKEEEEGKG